MPLSPISMAIACSSRPSSFCARELERFGGLAQVAGNSRIGLQHQSPAAPVAGRCELRHSFFVSFTSRFRISTLLEQLGPENRSVKLSECARLVPEFRNPGIRLGVLMLGRQDQG